MREWAARPALASHHSPRPMVAPMTIDSCSHLARAIEEHKLLDLGKLKELTGTLAPRFSTVRALAQEIARRGWLTSYQLNKVCFGNGHKLVFGPYIVLDRLGEG